MSNCSLCKIEIQVGPSVAEFVQKELFVYLSLFLFVTVSDSLLDLSTLSWSYTICNSLLCRETISHDANSCIARDFLEAGFHVMCEKPMTFNVAEAKQLRKVVQKSGKIFGLMHNYTGYPMVKLARDLVRGGELGLAAKTKVSYRAGDQPNNALSPGILEPGEIAVTAGTSGIVYGVGDKKNYDSNLASTYSCTSTIQKVGLAMVYCCALTAHTSSLAGSSITSAAMAWTIRK